MAFRGITVYVHELDLPQSGSQKTESQRGIGLVAPLAASGLVLLRVSLSERKPLVLAHELGHRLGLNHLFFAPQTDQPLVTAKFLKEDEVITAQQVARLAAAESEMAQLTIELAAPNPPPNAEAEWVQKQREITGLRDQITSANVLAPKQKDLLLVYEKNKFKFTQKASENIMDYTKGVVSEGTSAGAKATDRRVSYWHWQWVVMQQEVKNYYN